MTCAEWATLADALQNFAFHDAVACTYTDTAGTVATGMLTFGAVSTALGFRTGGITMPVILVLLVGSVLLPLLPGAATQMATLILLLAIGVGPVLVVRRIASGT